MGMAPIGRPQEQARCCNSDNTNTRPRRMIRAGEMRYRDGERQQYQGGEQGGRQPCEQELQLFISYALFRLRRSVQ